ncbi:BQ5605_C022g09477 [Microbotryum silenes-dioicae]|uniref:BQ5605_C022g09477 protein n=1 Tax=Microbotryum silenes-dioicae TaxID=796604 RepID=A0A2X0PKB9_9BASI|nr:BQ5605_C022g09477 [Microbotryum silenes-dioicae]
MDNNNNTNNASHAAIPPLRPDPPDPPGQAPANTTKSYSAAVGARSAAKHGNATANASTAVAAHPLMHNIENCVIINTPPSTSVEQVLLALDKYYPGLTGAMPCVIKGQRGLRFPKAADLDPLVANGLTVGKTLCKVEKLYSSTRGGVVQCTLTGFFSDPEGLCLFDEQIAAYGTVLRRRIQYIGKTKHISGVYDFILALKDVDVLPPASLSIARDGVTERIPLRITGGMRHCVFCRSAAHVRKDCPVAPACKSCASTSHATQHCPACHASSPQRPPTSRAPQASTVTTAAPAAVSKSISPASAHDRTTKKRRVEQDLAAQTEDLSNRAQPDSLSKNARPEFSFNFPCKTATPPAPQPASNQGIAYSLVEKSSESPSSETTSPSPSPPPATPKSIITRSKSIAALSKPATPEPRAVFAHGAALRSRLDPSLAGPSSIFIRLRKVRASDLIPSLTVNDVVHSDPDSMLGVASDYFERVYEDRPIDDAALKAIIDGLASTRLSPADSLKLEEAYPLEEMTKAQAACKSNSSPGPDGLPVEFYRATWPATGPILRDVINSIPTEARQPGPLPRNTAHIHLIHKRGERDQLSNKRPISLINADERIISQAHNQRLAPLLESLIGPTQRGFVPNRWIGTNIAEVQCLMDPRLPGSTPVSGMLAVMDFEKAYDRLSHPYLDAVLCAVGLGPKARQWYRATYTNQSASIFLNGWLSATFDILSGVRQGDPLAPSLFVLAIEGFACQIRLRVKGIDIAGLQNVRELLFADDACCALHNLSDLDHLNRAIELYERASASKLSNVKSFLYPLGAFRDRSIAPDLGTWRLSDSQFRYLGIQVGVEIAEDAGWEDVKALTIARIRSIPMYDLPFAAKCSIINIYCYTKILYYSRFLPAPKSVVKEIEEAAMLAIHGRASDGTQPRPKVSRSRLCTPLDHGGFGLIDLPRRLAIDHAKWVFQLRAPDGCFTRHLFDIRIRLQAPNEPTPFTLSRPAPNQHRCPWIWIWWAYFCHPPPKWDHAVRKTTKLLPARWVRYFEAWALVTTLNPPELSKSQNLEQWATHVLYFPAGHGIQLSVNPTLFRGPDGEVMTPSSFVNASKRHQVFIFPPTFPKGHQKVFDLPEQRWNAWWKALRKVRRVHSDAEDTGHLLSLGSLHPGSQVASPTSPHPNNRSTSCVTCLSEAPECLVHLAVGCPFARRLWSALSPTPHPVFVDFVCPVVSRSERRLVELRVLFFHSIWKLCRRRRFSSDLLEPITETEFEGLRASIQESKGRLVSL